jgi:hypothetical protein
MLTGYPALHSFRFQKLQLLLRLKTKLNYTPWPEPASELYRPSDSCLWAKLVPNFAYRGCHVVSVTDPYGRIIGSLDRSR